MELTDQSKPLLYELTDNVGHALLQDLMNEIRPDAIFGDALKELTSTLDELKPSSMVKYILFGK